MTRKLQARFIRHPIVVRKRASVRTSALANTTMCNTYSSTGGVNNDIVDEFMSNMLYFVCPDDVSRCNGVRIPDLQGQLDVLQAFHDIHHHTDLHGLDGVVWGMVVEGNMDAVWQLIEALQQYDVVVSGIRDLIGISGYGGGI